MSRQFHHKATDKSCHSAAPQDDAARTREDNFRQRLTAWLGVVVLAINLFGWTLAPSVDRPPSPAGISIAELFPEALSGQDVCEHDGNGKSHPGDSHDRMDCPACFPMGNSASGALASNADTLPEPRAPTFVRRSLPENRQAASAFHPFQYQARAPPRLA